MVENAKYLLHAPIVLQIVSAEWFREPVLNALETFMQVEETVWLLRRQLIVKLMQLLLINVQYVP